MVRKQVSIKVETFILSGFILVAGHSVARAQNFSGLQGKELRLSSDLESGVQSLVIDLLSGNKGRIDKVVVTDDRERRLAVRVVYRDLQGRLIGELKGKDGESQPEFSRASATLEQEDGEAELIFEPRPNPPAGAGSESGFLYLRVLHADRPVPEQELTFRLGKRWQLDGADPMVTWEAGDDTELTVVEITARPEGKAAELREDGRVVLPPLRIPVKTTTPGESPAAHGVTAAPRAGTQQGQPAIGIAERAPAAQTAVRTTPEQRRVMTKTAPAVQKLPAKKLLLKAERFHYGLGNDITSKQGKGPGSEAFELLEGLRAEPGLPVEAITRISRRVFQDQNPASGIYYFLPEAYYVGWDPDSGYALRMLYSAADAPGEAGEVMMAAQLDSGVDTSEIQLAEALMKAYHARHPQVAFTEVRQLPIDKAPEVSLAGDLQHQYDVAAERTSVSAFSDVLSEIQVSWVTDTITKENMQLALVEDVGINGAAILTPSGGGMPVQQIPVRVRLADADTLGPVFWRRDERWQNRMPYPIRLRYLHALLIEDDAPVVYTWNLDGATVPPQARVELDASRVPRWLDQRAVRMWVDYAPIGSCEPCDQAVVSAITGGVTSLGASQITFHTITPLADTGAYEIAVTVRSRYFDPKSRDRRTLPPLVLNADNQDFTIGPIYLVNRQPGDEVPGDPLFEYSVEVSMPDGETHRGGSWTPVDSLRVLIGRVQIEMALEGSLPESEEPVPLAGESDSP